MVVIMLSPTASVSFLGVEDALIGLRPVADTTISSASRPSTLNGGCPMRLKRYTGCSTVISGAKTSVYRPAISNQR